MARRWIATIVVLGVAATLGINLWRLWVATTSSPFATGVRFSAQGPALEGVEAEDVTVFAYEPGETILYRFGLVNTGSVPVTVTAIEAYPEGAPVLALPDAVEACEPDWRGCRPLEDVALGGGGWAAIRVESRFANCDRWPAGAAVSADRFLVRFVVLGIPSAAPLRLEQAAVVEAPEVCP